MNETPQQSIEWKSAIPLLDYMDQYALSDRGLREANTRLAERAVPAWACELRTKLITAGWHAEKPEGKESWVPDFALRSEVALVGLAIGHPFYTQAEQAYQRLFVRFMQEILRPLVVYAEQADSYRKRGYRPLVRLHALCERFEREGSSMVWPERLKSVSEIMQDWFRRLWLAGDLGMGNQIKVYEVACVSEAVSQLYGAISQRLNLALPVAKEPLQNDEIPFVLENLELCLRVLEAGLHHWGLIAAAYLAALESLCPPPDWLLLPEETTRTLAGPEGIL